MVKRAFVLGCLAFSNISFAEGDVNVANKYSGVFGGIGFAYQAFHQDLTIEDHFLEAYNEYQATAGPGGVAMPLDPEILSATKCNAMGNTRGGKVGISLTTGWGCFPISDLYSGVELTLDIVGHKNSEQVHKIYKGTKSKAGGTVVTFVFKVGQYLKSIDTLYNIRVGFCSYGVKCESQYMDRRTFKNNKVCFVLGGEVVKNISDGLSIKAGIDYKFSSKKKWSDLVSEKTPPGEVSSLESDKKGIAIHLGLIKNF